jgi:hypothetical protein
VNPSSPWRSLPSRNPRRAAPTSVKRVNPSRFRWPAGAAVAACAADTR